MATTPHYNLNEIGPGGSLADDSWKYGTTDRVTIDQKLWLGAEGHHHTGAIVGSVGAGPSLTLANVLGTLVAATTYYYRYSVVDNLGNESVASAETSITTPAQITDPAAPILTVFPTGGSLSGGNYTYYLSAYQGDTRNETRASNAGFITVSAGSTSKVRVTFPSLPLGATGFNVYRRVPNGAIAEFLVSVSMDVATPPTYWEDTGSIEGDCDRTLPTSNRTSSSNAVIVTLPGATPSLPSGYTWKIYRTRTSGVYTSSLLHHVVEFTDEATPVNIVTSYTDVGNSTTAGSPLETTIGSPTKILLTDGAEVQGELPTAYVEGFPYEIVFSFGGTLELQDGQFIWYCPFVTAEILWVRPVLGVESTPAVQPVVIDIRRGNGPICPTFDSLWIDPTNRPKVEVGYQYGAGTVPDFPSLVEGDLLICDIAQTGGGATPTDRNLTVTVFIKARFA